MIAMQNTMHKFVQQPLTHAHGPEWIRGMASIQNATLLEKAHGCIPLLVTYPRAPMLQERRHMLIDALANHRERDVFQCNIAANGGRKRRETFNNYIVLHQNTVSSV